jgi:hypothetical protein
MIFAFIAFLLGVLACVFWIWMLVDCIGNSRLSTGEKVGWVLVIIFLHALGALIYYLLGSGRLRE